MARAEMSPGFTTSEISDRAENKPFFPPEGKVREIHQETVLLLAAPAAILMQVAHPLVSQGVKDHSYFKENLTRRLVHTVTTLNKLVFGTEKDSRLAAQHVNKVHRPVQGQLSESVGTHQEGTSYNAKDPQLLQWVWGTLVDADLNTYETFCKELSNKEKESYYQEFKRILPLLGGKRDQTPETYQDFRGYMNDMYESKTVHVSETAKNDIAPYILLQASDKLPGKLITILKPLSLPSEKITAGLLPEPLREQYGLMLTPVEQKAFDAIAGVNKLIPRMVRHYPIARQAEQRDS